MLILALNLFQTKITKTINFNKLLSAGLLNPVLVVVFLILPGSVRWAFVSYEGLAIMRSSFSYCEEIET